jgi:hypothetical protein
VANVHGQDPLPKAGCFVATHPSTEWQEVPCGPAPQARPGPPPSPPPAPQGPQLANGSVSIETVGGSPGVDETASVQDAGQHISWAEGSFPSVIGVTSETDSAAGSNQYSLQLNSNWFNTSLCSGSKNPSCQGFEQFDYSQSNSSGPGYAGYVWIQYWLISYYNPTACMMNCCPAGWSDSGGDCVLDSQSSTDVPFRQLPISRA